MVRGKGSVWEDAKVALLDHFLQAFQGLGFNDVASGLGFEDGFLFGERVDSLAGLGGRLAYEF